MWCIIGISIKYLPFTYFLCLRFTAVTCVIIIIKVYSCGEIEWCTWTLWKSCPDLRVKNGFPKWEGEDLKIEEDMVVQHNDEFDPKTALLALNLDALFPENKGKSWGWNWIMNCHTYYIKAHLQSCTTVMNYESSELWRSSIHCNGIPNDQYSICPIQCGIT